MGRPNWELWLLCTRAESVATRLMSEYVNCTVNTAQLVIIRIKEKDKVKSAQ